MRVLIVEDDQRIVDFVQRGLKAEGYVVEVARNGHEAVALGSEGQFQVIILDLGLPDLNGREVCERLRAIGIATPIPDVDGQRHGAGQGHRLAFGCRRLHDQAVLL